MRWCGCGCGCGCGCRHPQRRAWRRMRVCSRQRRPVITAAAVPSAPSTAVLPSPRPTRITPAARRVRAGKRAAVPACSATWRLRLVKWWPRRRRRRNIRHVAWGRVAAASSAAASASEGVGSRRQRMGAVSRCPRRVGQRCGRWRTAVVACCFMGAVGPIYSWARIGVGWHMGRCQARSLRQQHCRGSRREKGERGNQA